MLDLNRQTITSTLNFTEAGFIFDIVAFDENHYLLGAGDGLFKTTKDQILKHYQNKEPIRNICHIAGSFYFLGLEEQLCLWNEDTDEQIYRVISHDIFSIKRVMTTNTFIIRSKKGGV